MGRSRVRAKVVGFYTDEEGRVRPITARSGRRRFRVKLVTKVVKGKEITRSERAWKIDEAKQAKNVTEDVEKYAKRPDRLDMPGVDTPSKPKSDKADKADKGSTEAKEERRPPKFPEPPEVLTKEWIDVTMRKWADEKTAYLEERMKSEGLSALLAEAEKDFQPTVVIAETPKHVAVSTPYKADFVDEIKEKTKTRKFVGTWGAKSWVVEASEKGVVEELVKKHFPGMKVRYVKVKSADKDAVLKAMEYADWERRLALRPYDRLTIMKPGKATREERVVYDRIEEMASKNVYANLVKALAALHAMY
jgi:ribosomal protein L20